MRGSTLAFKIGKLHGIIRLMGSLEHGFNKTRWVLLSTTMTEVLGVTKTDELGKKLKR